MSNKIKINQLAANLPETTPIYTTVADQSICVTPIIPYEDVLDMIQWSIDCIVGERDFISYPLYTIFTEFAILKYFTNLDFSFLTDIANYSDIYAAYDIIAAQDVLNTIKPLISQIQLSFYENTLHSTMESIITYRNSAAGILTNLQLRGQDNAASLDKALNQLKELEGENSIQQIIEYVNSIQPKK